MVYGALNAPAEATNPRVSIKKLKTRGYTPVLLQGLNNSLKPVTPLGTPRCTPRDYSKPITPRGKNAEKFPPQTVSQWLVKHTKSDLKDRSKVPTSQCYPQLSSFNSVASASDGSGQFPESIPAQTSLLEVNNLTSPLAEDEEFVHTDALIPVIAPQDSAKCSNLLDSAPCVPSRPVTSGTQTSGAAPSRPMTSGTQTSSAASTLSPALAKHRKKHPRLQWPRLANQQSLEVQRSTEAQYCALSREATPVFISRNTSNSRAPSSWNGMMEASRPAILPRASPRSKMDSGTMPLTFNGAVEDLPEDNGTDQRGFSIEDAPAEDDDVVSVGGNSARSAGTTFTFLSEASSGRDRKWCVRMPPVSCAIPALKKKSQSSHNFHKGGSSSSSSAPTTAPTTAPFSSRGTTAPISSRGTTAPTSRGKTPGGNGTRDGSSNESQVPSTAQTSVTRSVGEYFNFENWGIDDTYLSSLCQTYSESLCTIKYVILAHNRITKKGVKEFFDKLDSPQLESLNMEENRIGSDGCFVIAQALRTWSWPLVELNLSGNDLGDAAVERLCDGLLLCKQLSGLGLAKNSLGTNDNAGRALGFLLSGSSSIAMVDLHWNHFHGSSGFILLQGIYDNAENKTGSLARLNLAWNSLGKRIKRGPDSNYAELSAKMLASVFQSSQTLFHLDISYNGLRAAECKILADGLRTNHTLFGIHLNGNECALDDLGFIQPQPSKSEEEEVAVAAPSGYGSKVVRVNKNMVVGEQQERMNRYVENIPKKCSLEFVCQEISPQVSPKGEEAEQLGNRDPLVPKGFKGLFKDSSTTSLASFHSRQSWDVEPEMEWVNERAKVQRPETFGSTIDDYYRRNARCCWICENWTEYEVEYIPGLSDNDHEEQDIKQVFAFFSVDNFTRPIKLTRVEEVYSRRQHKPATPKTQGRQPKLSANGKLVRWVGERMLPPSFCAMHVVFQVNDHFRASDDMPSSTLHVAKRLTLQTTKDFPIAEGTAPVDVAKVNRVQVGVKALEKFLKGNGNPLVILEDRDKRDKCLVVPRKLPDKYEHKVRSIWTFDMSVWKDYKFDTETLYDQCFDFDWSCTRLEKFIRGSKSEISSKNLRDMFKSFARPVYNRVVAAYRCIISQSESTGKYPFGATMLDYTQFLSSLSPDFFNSQFSIIRDSDAIFIASNLITDKELKENVFLVTPEKGLARCQFLEAMVRVAHKKYLQTEKCCTIAASFKELLSVLDNRAQPWVDLRKELMAQLFNEENDILYKEYKSRMRTIFDWYKLKFQHPGGSKDKMSFTSWLTFAKDADALHFISKRQITEAFLLAQETRVDELKSWRHMEMSFTEFMVGLGAIMKLRKDFEPYFFADMLDEFFEDNLQQVLEVMQQEMATRSHGLAKNRQQKLDPTLIAVLDFLRRIFESADDDRSGTIDLREFRMAFSAPEVQEEMKGLGLNFTDVGLLFRQVDVDGSGSCTLDEMSEGFIKMKLAMAGMERALAYIQRVFEEADTDQSGYLSREEFLDFFTSESVQRKLNTLGVDTSECEDILLLVDGDGDGAISVEELMNGFLQMRDANKSGNKAMNYMNTLFREADKDGSGTLCRQEFKNAFTDERCINKLKRLHLTLPDWSSLFEQLDTDESGDVSWEELSAGMQIFWQNSKVEEAEKLQAKRNERASVTVAEPSQVDEAFPSPSNLNVAMKKASLLIPDMEDATKKPSKPRSPSKPDTEDATTKPSKRESSRSPSKPRPPALTMGEIVAPPAEAKDGPAPTETAPEVEVKGPAVIQSKEKRSSTHPKTNAKGSIR